MFKTLLFTGLIYLLTGIQLVFAQTKTYEQHLTAKEWKIYKDSMKGTGTHISLPKDAKIVFQQDGKWKATHPLQGLTEGTWSFSDPEKLILTDQNNQNLILKIVKLDNSELNFKTTIKLATYQYVFK